MSPQLRGHPELTTQPRNQHHSHTPRTHHEAELKIYVSLSLSGNGNSYKCRYNEILNNNDELYKFTAASSVPFLSNIQNHK